MKRNTTLLKIVIVFVSIVLTTNLFSQIDSTYVPFPTDSVAWNETSCGWINGRYDISCTNKFLFLIGDTIIDSLVYSKLYFGYKLFGINHSNAQVLGGIREENKKVYFKELGNTEKLFYDFNLSVGDSFFFGNLGMKELLSIDSVEIVDGSFRKRYNFESRTVVEGVGDVSTTNSGLLSPEYNFLDATNSLHCVITPSKVIYKNENVVDHNCYELGVAIREFKENNQLIYPNPFKNTLNFTEKLSGSKVVLYSISGQKVFVDNNFSGNSLDLHFLEKGIYYLKVATEKSYYQKIVKL